jgi:putative endonuclease
MPRVYILKCVDGAFYTGSTVDLERRLFEHNAGLGANFTRRRLPVTVVFCAQTENLGEAFRSEKRVQGWSPVKKLALIEGRWNDLPGLSRRRIPNG